MARPAVAIAHDYLTQRGGAERVVLSMRKAFPDARIHTTLYYPEGTYPEFRDAEIITSPLNRLTRFRRDHRMALPLLSPASSSLQVDADVAIISSSGWAHGFPAEGHKVVYCHNPARWLYQTNEYLGGNAWRHPMGPAVLAMRPMLRRWDRRAADTVDHYLANSRIVQRRIAMTYDRHAELLPPPHSMDPTAPQEAITEIADLGPGYALVVSRLMPYKNVDKAIAAVRRSRRPLVIIGHGPEAERLKADLPPHVRMLSGLSDAQMRWAYANAGVLVAPSYEDFGLTPLEAAAFGVPTIALRAGGYLDTILEGTTGLHFEDPTPDSIAMAIHEAYEHPWDRQAILARADDFSERHFIERLNAIANDVLSTV